MGVSGLSSVADQAAAGRGFGSVMSGSRLIGELAEVRILINRRVGPCDLTVSSPTILRRWASTPQPVSTINQSLCAH